eukprot:4328978-Amphidinium_carterae.1
MCRSPPATQRYGNPVARRRAAMKLQLVCWFVGGVIVFKIAFGTILGNLLCGSCTAYRRIVLLGTGW